MNATSADILYGIESCDTF